MRFLVVFASLHFSFFRSNASLLLVFMINTFTILILFQWPKILTMFVCSWDRTKVVDYLLANTAFSRAYAELQADRYAAWPGQATSYKMGERAIRALREKKENHIGFDLREFHADYLSCLGFMDDLEECVEEREVARGAMLRRRGKNHNSAASNALSTRTTFMLPALVTVGAVVMSIFL